MKKMAALWKLLNGRKTIVANLYWGTLMPALMVLYPEGVPAGINKWVVILGFFLTSVGMGHKWYKKANGVAVALLCVLLVGCGGRTAHRRDVVVQKPKVEVYQPDRYTTPEELVPVRVVDIPVVDPLTLYFPLNSTLLDECEIEKGMLWAEKNNAKAVSLLGGACPLGEDSYNYGLGMRRGEAAAGFFGGIGVEVVAIESCGETKLVSDEPRLYWMNRRVEVGLR